MNITREARSNPGDHVKQIDCEARTTYEGAAI
jgi:hypothetical protein